MKSQNITQVFKLEHSIEKIPADFEQRLSACTDKRTSEGKKVQLLKLLSDDMNSIKKTEDDYIIINGIANDGNELNNEHFKIDFSKVRLDEFNKFPVLIDQHVFSGSLKESIVGKVYNIYVDKQNRLLFTGVVFDEQMVRALKLFKQVAISIGFTAYYDEVDYDKDGTLTVTNIEVYEISLVLKGANPKAIGSIEFMEGDKDKEDDKEHIEDIPTNGGLEDGNSDILLTETFNSSKSIEELAYFNKLSEALKSFNSKVNN